MTIDRWFVTGTGIVKDITTISRLERRLLERISLELTERPKIVNRPEVNVEAATKKLSVSVAKERFGKPTTAFSWTHLRFMCAGKDIACEKAPRSA